MDFFEPWRWVTHIGAAITGCRSPCFPRVTCHQLEKNHFFNPNILCSCQICQLLYTDFTFLSTNILQPPLCYVNRRHGCRIEAHSVRAILAPVATTRSVQPTTLDVIALSVRDPIPLFVAAFFVLTRAETRSPRTCSSEDEPHSEIAPRYLHERC